MRLLRECGSLRTNISVHQGTEALDNNEISPSHVFTTRNIEFLGLPCSDPVFISEIKIQVGFFHQTLIVRPQITAKLPENIYSVGTVVSK